MDDEGFDLALQQIFVRGNHRICAINLLDIFVLPLLTVAVIISVMSLFDKK